VALDPVQSQPRIPPPLHPLFNIKVTTDKLKINGLYNIIELVSHGVCVAPMFLESKHELNFLNAGHFLDRSSETTVASLFI